MLNQEVDDLTKALARIRLDREELTRALDNTNKQESKILKSLQTAQTAAATAVAATAREKIEKNPYKKGDLLRVTNALRREFGTTGTVIKSGVTFVTIQSRKSRRNKSYTTEIKNTYHH